MFHVHRQVVLLALDLAGLAGCFPLFGHSNYQKFMMGCQPSDFIVAVGGVLIKSLHNLLPGVHGAHAHPLHPAALASVPYGIVLVRVRVRAC